MQKNPRVSIITPSYNQARFIEQTIQSVLNQDYPDLEYIIVDGASTDDSVEIIKKYAGCLAYWLSEPDSGQSEAVNKGWQRATGEIIGWLNSDDLLMPGAVSRMVKAFQETPEMSVIYGDVISIDQEGQIFNIMRFDQWNLDDLMTFKIISQPGAFMRADVLRQSGYLDRQMHFLMDTHLWLKMAQFAPIRYLPGVVAAARYHPGAKNVAAGARYGQDAYKIVEWMKTQPILQEKLLRNPRQVWAGAHRISARYLLDGGDAKSALRDYLKAFRSHPPAVREEAHRIFFCMLSLVGMGGLKQIYYQQRLKRRRRQQPDVYGSVERFLTGEVPSDSVS